ncbi:MAG: glycosyltransferase [Actinomycetes bacterium]
MSRLGEPPRSAAGLDAATPATTSLTGRSGVTATDLRIGIVGPVPPRRCAVAEETAWMRDVFTAAGAQVHLAAVTEDDLELDRPMDAGGGSAVDLRAGMGVADALWRSGIAGAERSSLRAMANTDVVVVHHRPGLHGPDDEAGSPLVRFLQRCPAPTALVLHDVPTATDPRGRERLARLVALADGVIVHSDIARRRVVAALDDLGESHRASAIHVVPRAAVLGAPTTPPRPAGPSILTFGFLDPDKSIEDAVVAVAELNDLSPPAQYNIVGPTATDVVALEGEHYRSGLRILAKAMKVDDRVCIQDGYLPPAALAALIAAADVIVLPYTSHDVTSSAVLVESLAAGRPVVATAFPHAVELLSDGAGMLVSPGDRGALTSAVRRVLTRPQTAAAMRAQAAAIGAQFQPDRVTAAYLTALRSLRSTIDLRTNVAESADGTSRERSSA